MISPLSEADLISLEQAFLNEHQAGLAASESVALLAAYTDMPFLIAMARESYTFPGSDLSETDNDRAIFDLDLPDFVRAFLAIHLLPAMHAWAVRTSGFMPKLYARHDGRPVRVVFVSRLGDVGVSTEDKEFGTYHRCSIYDLTDFTKDMHNE